MTSKGELRNLNALDQIGVLINVRESLTRLRNNEVEQAINDLEMFLDCTASALLLDFYRCDETTKEIVIQEFRRLSIYRNQWPKYPSTYLNSLDPDVREGTLKRRSEIEKILEEFSNSAGTKGVRD